MVPGYGLNHIEFDSGILNVTLTVMALREFLAKPHQAIVKRFIYEQPLDSSAKLTVITDMIIAGDVMSYFERVMFMWSRRHFADARPVGMVLLKAMFAPPKAPVQVVDNLATVALPLRRLSSVTR